jgi:tetratricopeptide (TPR) repeat protein
MAYAREGQWGPAERSFRRAIELDRNRSTSYAHFAYYLLYPLGRTDEALRQLHVAEKTDPLSPAVHFELAYVLRSAGRYDEAAGYCQKEQVDSAAKSECRPA